MKTTKEHFETCSVKKAAAPLGKTPVALRHELRRKQRLENGRIVAEIDGGAIGYKRGRVWRIRLPERTGDGRATNVIAGNVSLVDDAAARGVEGGGIHVSATHSASLLRAEAAP